MWNRFSLLRPAQRSRSCASIILSHPTTILCGDAGRIRQVLINLITNAIKYTPDGGRIDIAVQEVSSHLQRIRRLVFTVADTGIGMSKDFLDYIFVPFPGQRTPKPAISREPDSVCPLHWESLQPCRGNIQVEVSRAKATVLPSPST